MKAVQSEKATFLFKDFFFSITAYIPVYKNFEDAIVCQRI